MIGKSFTWLFLIFSVCTGIAQSKCDIVEIYERQKRVGQDKSDLVLADGIITDEYTLLRPVRSFDSPQELKVSKDSRDIYVTPNKQFYINTQYCHQYAKYRSVIIKYDPKGIGVKGSVIFDP